MTDLKSRGVATLVIAVRSQAAQVLAKVAGLHQLHEDEGGLALAHHTQQLHHVGCVDLLQI